MNPRAALLLLPLLAAGCGPPGLAQVSGRVTLDGRPLPNAGVNFQPVAKAGKVEAGPGSYGKTDADGRYTLRVVGDDRPGAQVGPHRVEITAFAGTAADDVDARKAPTSLVPARYNRETELTFQVKSGPNEANFELTSK